LSFEIWVGLAYPSLT